MSVINKMLRDLDTRPTVSPLGSSREKSAVLTAGTVAMGKLGLVDVAAKPPTSLALRLAAVLILVLMSLLAYLWWTRPVVQSVAPAPVPSLAVPAQSLPNAALTESKPITSVKPEVKPQPSAPLAKSVTTQGPAPVAPALKATVTPIVAAPTVAKPVPAAMAVPALPPAPVTAQAPSAPAVTTVAPKSLRQLALDALAQAQIQWAEGARQSAIDLVKATLMRLEQSAPGDSATLATLTRDYVRMVLAQGQTQEALATLERLEPHLAGVADIWALRGNAAQRLGRHAQAISAYSKAMALRPDEARWMLGAAVSMAASGQIGPAGDLAEKVRLAGALPPDVASYLRQLGVVIRTP